MLYKCLLIIIVLQIATIIVLLYGAENCKIHMILLMYPVLKNHIQISVVKEQYKIKLAENKIYATDSLVE